MPSDVTVPRQPDNQPGGPDGGQSPAMASSTEFETLLSEVFLLLDFVSGRAEKSLDQLAGIWVPGRPAGAPASTKDEVITHLCKLRYPSPEHDAALPEDVAFLLVVKDRLNTLTGPARSLTIAFTAMAVTPARIFASGKSSRATLALRAYPALAKSARRQRLLNAAGCGLMVVLTGVTVFTSGVVAFGQKALQDITAAAALQERIGDQIHSAELALAQSPRAPAGTQPTPTGPFLRLCDRVAERRWQSVDEVMHLDVPEQVKQSLLEITKVQTFDDPNERFLCDAASDAGQKIKVAYGNLYDLQDLSLYIYEAPLRLLAGMPRQQDKSAEAQASANSAIEAAPARTSGRSDGTRPSLVTEASGSVTKSNDAGAAAKTPEVKKYVHGGDQWVALVLASLGGYLLPMCFTLLGSMVSIARDICDKMRTSTLDPRDGPLAFARLALGLVAGAAIGLFISPSGSASAGGVQAISLSASALAFLAGYGVDSVFALFDSLLQRVADWGKPKAA